MAVQELAAGWQFALARELPEQVTALAAAPNPRGTDESIFVGTGPSGGLYKFSSMMPQELLPLAVGLGDSIKFGTCLVSSVAVRDLNHDGIPELIAETCQVAPRGRPRLYIWSLEDPPVLRGVARPDIASSWSHGFGFSERRAPGPDTIVSTYCGYGEVVEYELTEGETPEGFRSENVAWRRIAQLPASGEGCQINDLDNDGEPEVCLATGFAPGRAAIEIHTFDEHGLKPQAKRVLDEGGRFGNVKFLIGDLRGDGSQELIAWWCTEAAGGNCLVARYRFGPEGLEERNEIARGDAALLWPIDGQTALAARAGEPPEIWFATTSGNLWRYDSAAPSALARVCHIQGGIGPITAGHVGPGNEPALYIGHDRLVLELTRLHQANPSSLNSLSSDGKFQIRTSLSSPPVASRNPFGLKAVHRTPPG